MLFLNAKKSHWKNWSSYQSCYSQIFYPNSTDEIIEIIRYARKNKMKIRPVGSGHSFSSLVPTDQIIINLKKVSGLIEIDHRNKVAHFFGGTKLSELNKILFNYQLALPNMGDVDVQTIAGATATGTHGTGIDFCVISDQIIEVTYVDGLGNLHVVGQENPEKLACLKINLGSVGVIVSLKLKVIDAFKVEMNSEKMRLSDILSNIDNLISQNRNFEFFWFPRTNFAQVKKTNLVSNTIQIGPNKYVRLFNDLFLENIVYGAFITLAVQFKFLSQIISNIVVLFIGRSKKVDWSHQIYATPRLNKFNEMELSIPLSQLDKALNIIKQVTIEHDKSGIIPVEVRTVKADEILLSPAYRRDSFYVAIHCPKGELFEDYFRSIFELLLPMGARPHWGKWSRLSRGEFQQCFSEYEKFESMRSKSDPDNIFLNHWLDELLVRS